MTNIGIRDHGQAHVSEPRRDAELPHTVVPGCQVLAVAAWTGVRDTVATLGACAVAYLGTVLARETCRAVPPLHALFSCVNAIAVGTTAYVFAAGVGTEGWHPQRRWIGGAAAVVCTGLTVYATYRGQGGNDGTKQAISLFGTVVYSMARELLQNQGRRMFPELRTAPRRALHWEGGSNTCRHLTRLAVGSAIYATSSVLLNGLAKQSIISSNFGDLDQSLGLFSQDSWRTFALRAVNEGLDGFTGILLLAAFFRADLQRKQGYCSNQRDGVRTALVGASSRVSTNLTINSIQALIPSNHISLLLLQGVTSFRGALQSAKLRQAERIPVNPNTLQDANLVVAEFGGASSGNTPHQRITPRASQGTACQPWNTSQVAESNKKDQ